MNKQVEKSHYKFEEYNGIERWCSYYYQITEILKLKQHNILEIGIGSNILKGVLENELDYFSCDIDEDINPDYIQDISKLNIDRKFDIVCAFQVLEHLPFSLFEKSLKRMGDISNKYVIISIPRYGIRFRTTIKIPTIGPKSFSVKIPYLKEFKFGGEHYWEIDGNGVTEDLIKKAIEKNFTIIRDYIIPENAYHKIYVLEKKYKRIKQ